MLQPEKEISRVFGSRQLSDSELASATYFFTNAAQAQLHCKLPIESIDALARYVVLGIEPGSFLYAVLCNDLKQAAANADSRNQILLYHYAFWMYNVMPGDSQGSPQKVQSWMQRTQKESSHADK